ncbi:hypothetical protein [Agrobacterium sp. CG674]
MKAKLIINTGSGNMIVRIPDVTDHAINEHFVSLKTKRSIHSYATRTVVELNLEEVVH